MLEAHELERASGEPGLQIIVTYNGLFSTHAALRLVHHKRGVLFWDPAGVYGVGDADHGVSDAEGITRANDLIVENAPDLRQYWSFALGTGDSGLEVLEWRLTRERAEELYESLLGGAGIGEKFVDFHTDATAPLCAWVLSDFLQRFAGDLMRVPELYFSPASLARALRSQTPRRVLIFLRGGTLLEFRDGAVPPSLPQPMRSAKS